MTLTGRGSSEVVGFALIFAIVFAGVGGVYVAGFDTLTELRAGQEVANAERAFVVLAGSLDDVRSGSVARSGVLSPGRGRLQLDAGPTVSVAANGTNRSIETGALAYVADGTRVTHVSGGVFRADRGDGVLRREPALACRAGSDAAVLSLVRYRPRRGGVDADGPVEVVARPTSTRVWRADDVRVNVSPSSHDDVWGRYLARTGWNGSTAPVYRCDAGRTVVRITTVRVRFVS